MHLGTHSMEAGSESAIRSLLQNRMIPSNQLTQHFLLWQLEFPSNDERTNATAAHSPVIKIKRWDGIGLQAAHFRAMH